MSKVVAPSVQSPARRFSVDKSDKENSPLEVNRLKSLLKSTVNVDKIAKDASPKSTGAIKKTKNDVLVKLKNGTTLKLCSTCVTENENVTKEKKTTKPRVAAKKTADTTEKKRAPRKTKTAELQSKTTISKIPRPRKTANKDQGNKKNEKAEKLADNAKTDATSSQGSQDVIENSQKETNHTRKPRVIKKKQVQFDDEFETENTDLSKTEINFDNVTKRRSMRKVPDSLSKSKLNDETLTNNIIVENATKKKTTRTRNTAKQPFEDESESGISKFTDVSKSSKDSSTFSSNKRTTRKSMGHALNSESGYLTDLSKSLTSDSTTSANTLRYPCKFVKAPIKGESRHETSNLTNTSSTSEANSSFTTKRRTTRKSTAHDLKCESGYLADVSKSLRSDDVPTLTNAQELSTLQIQQQAGASTSAEALQKSESELKSPKEGPNTSKISEHGTPNHSYVNLPNAGCLYNSLLDNTLVQGANEGHSTSVEGDGLLNVQHPEIGSSSENIRVAAADDHDENAIKSERQHAKELHVTKEEYDLLHPIYKDRSRYKLVIVDPDVQKQILSSGEKPGTSSGNANELASHEDQEDHSSPEKGHCRKKLKLAKSKEEKRSERQMKTDLKVAKATAKLSKLCAKVKSESSGKGKLIIPQLSSSSESYDSDSSTECDSSCSCNNSFSSGDRCSCWICKQKVVSSATSDDTDYSIESPYYGSPSESSSHDSSSSESSDSAPGCRKRCKYILKGDEKPCACRKECKRRH